MNDEDNMLVTFLEQEKLYDDCLKQANKTSRQYKGIIAAEELAQVGWLHMAEVMGEIHLGFEGTVKSHLIAKAKTRMESTCRQAYREVAREVDLEEMDHDEVTHANCPFRKFVGQMDVGNILSTLEDAHNGETLVEVMEMRSRGLTEAAIAEQLNVCQKTVNLWVGNATGKLSTALHDELDLLEEALNEPTMFNYGDNQPFLNGFWHEGRAKEKHPVTVITP